MKKSWSSKWVGSTQPRKQRKYRYNAPLHIKRKFLSAHLSKELRGRFGKRSVSLRKGDEIVVMKGEFKGFRGNVERFDSKKSKIYIDGIKRKKVDGSEVSIPLDPSNVMIVKLTLEDKMRQAVFERSGKSGKPQKIEKEVKKPEKDHAKKDAHQTKKPSQEEKDW